MTNSKEQYDEHIYNAQMVWADWANGIIKKTGLTNDNVDNLSRVKADIIGVGIKRIKFKTEFLGDTIEIILERGFFNITMKLIEGKKSATFYMWDVNSVDGFHMHYAHNELCKLELR